jgi:CheY-like chemotaxis protein
MAKKIILIVEDNPVVRYLEERILRQEGYDTRWTDATSVAWDYIHQGWVSLLVLDADVLRQHPNGDLKREEGLRFLKELRKSPKGSRSALPIVTTTGEIPPNTPSWEDACLGAEANAFFEHEFDLDEFVLIVKQLLPIP